MLQDYDINQLEPTPDREYWDNINKSIKYCGSLPILLNFPPTPQGDINAVVFCSKLGEKAAREGISLIEEEIDNMKPFGCTYFMAFSIPLAIDFIIIYGFICKAHF